MASLLSLGGNLVTESVSRARVVTGSVLSCQKGVPVSRLTDLLRTVEQLDVRLAKDLDDEIRPLQKRLPFGLNFERHAPEAVELAGHRVRKGNKVRVLPSRGSTAKGDQRLWLVDAVNDDVAQISTPNGDESEVASVPVCNLVLVAEFRDRIYPGLRPDGTVELGSDKPSHTVINGENFHVLELLTFTHERSVDAIYIDPPYNTGSRDWKYNNDYVEGDDLYRHSKWLAFMERRLKLAKRLLKPDDSVLIVTIDEKEYLRLGLLLEQTFPEARIQMVSSVIKPGGVSRKGHFARSDEYVYFVMFGRSAPSSASNLDGFGFRVPAASGAAKDPLYWNTLWRSGSNARRSDRPELFYPIFLDQDGRVLRAGAPLPQDVDRQSVTGGDGEIVVWPIRQDGSEGRWQLGPATLMSRVESGYVKTGKLVGESTRLYHLSSGEIKKIAAGEVPVVGERSDGSVIGAPQESPRSMVATSQWNAASHDATRHGTMLLSSLLSPGRFPFPKSLYAVEDALRFFVSDKRDAVVLDFFSGSGTTAHAVMRLNKQDGGKRQCISVTNNEVSAEEQVSLRKQGLRPGDPEWEKWGICEYITKPRIRAAIQGQTPEGDRVKGDYKFIDEFPISDGFEENAAFFTLTYESPWMVEADRAFAAIAPMLWLRAGAVGERIDTIEGGWSIADSYGVIKDLDLASDFIAELGRRQDIRIAYVVTDDDGRYQQVAREIPDVETVRLYEDYLRNCESTGEI